MSGTFNVMPVVAGQVQSVLASLYQSGGGVTYVKQVYLFCQDVNPQTITVYLTPNGSSAVPIRQFKLSQNQSGTVCKGGEPITLAQGDAIQAVTAEGGLVDFSVTGVLET